VIIAHKSERGEVEYISTIARDISEVKRAEAALQESEKRFRAIFEQAAVGIAQVSLSGQFLQVNQRYCDLIRYTESELLGRTCQDLIHPDDRELTVEYQRQMLAGEISTYSLEKRYIRKDSQMQWVNSTVSLVRNSQGLPGYYIKVLEDISKRKQAEAALQRQLAAVEAARDGIAIVNSAQEYIYLNQAHIKLYGYDSSTELVGKTWRELYYPDEIRRLEQDIFPIVLRQGHWHGEAIGKKRDGSTFFQEVSLTLTADGGLICVCRDITERKQAEIDRQQQVERERLVGAISLSVHQSLELKKILNTTVTEVRQFLQTDRVLIYRFNPDWSGQVVVESVGADWTAVLDSTIHDPCFGKNYAQLYQQGRVRAIANIYTAGLTPCYVDLLAPLQVTAILTVPILVGERLWGLLIIHHCRGMRQWQSYDIELMQQLATQVAIAVQQSELYQQLQAELLVRQQTEEALRQSAATNSALLNAIPDMIFRCRADGTYVGFKPSPDIKTTVPPSVFIGKKVHEVLPPELAHRVLSAHEQALRSGETQILEYQLAKDDQLHDYEARFVAKDSDEIIAIVRDITERKRTETAIRQQKELLQTIFDHIPVMICFFDATGQILLLNREFERILGWSLAELGDVDLMAECYPELEYRTQVWDFMQQATGKWHDFKSRTRYGTYVDSSWANIRLSDGTAIGIGSDISERKRAEEVLQMLTQQEREKAQQLEQALKELQRTQAQLVQNEKMVSLGQLIAGIAHEINNPTSFIYGNIYPASEYAQDLLHVIELYQQYYPQPVAEIAEQLECIDINFIADDFPKLLASMKEGAHRISEIVQSLRNFSRLDEMECKRVDIHEGIDNTLLILKQRLTTQPHRPEIQVIKDYGELPLIECYPGQLNQVFMNIIGNAIDAIASRFANDALEGLKVSKLKVESWEDNPQPSNLQPSNLQPSTPCIRIHTEVVEHKWVAIRIADNGLGIKSEVQPKIFDPFFTTKPVGKGTGLGLSISYQIVVDKHGGQLRCHSVPGFGAEFVIELPIELACDRFSQDALAKASFKTKIDANVSKC
jgi:PAS domain S-box-containing protein